MATENNDRKGVYSIIEREGAKARWIRVGIAFTNRDGSLNLVLEALPTNGKLHVRDFPKGEDGAGDDARPAENAA